VVVDELFEVGAEGHLTGRIKFEVFHSVGGGRDSVASFGGLYAAYAPETAVAEQHGVAVSYYERWPGRTQLAVAKGLVTPEELEARWLP
jgi:hypothetical protein